MSMVLELIMAANAVGYLEIWPLNSRARDSIKNSTRRRSKGSSTNTHLSNFRHPPHPALKPKLTHGMHSNHTSGKEVQIQEMARHCKNWHRVAVIFPLPLIFSACHFKHSQQRLVYGYRCDMSGNQCLNHDATLTSSFLHLSMRFDIPGPLIGHPRMAMPWTSKSWMYKPSSERV